MNNNLIHIISSAIESFEHKQGDAVEMVLVDMLKDCKAEIQRFNEIKEAVKQLKVREFRFCGNESNMGYAVEDIQRLFGIFEEEEE